MRDREAYPIVADGRLFWIQDAYTVTRRHPYATPYRKRLKYIRNSVKAVLDAYHGTIDYYVADPSDPMIATYQAIFPGLFKPLEEMPDSLKARLRYPHISAKELRKTGFKSPGSTCQDTSFTQEVRAIGMGL
jgi:hypothetical protein